MRNRNGLTLVLGELNIIRPMLGLALGVCTHDNGRGLGLMLRQLCTVVTQG